MMNYNLIELKFREHFGTTPTLVRAPGRINLIGEHTDYNGGFVLPAAIDKEMVLAVGRNRSERCRIFSIDYDEGYEFRLDTMAPTDRGWPNYIMGVVDQLQKAGYVVGGFDCIFGGDIPIGAGLSSSAALECGTAYALSELFGLNIDKSSIIQFAQKAEHTFAGVQCGIMDQFASVMGKEAHAIRLDCRSLDFSYFPLELQAYQIILCDTDVKHSLASSEYNTRRGECEAGVAKVKENHPAVESLRDVSLAMLEEVKEVISAAVYKRCRYVIEENERLLQGCALLEKGDIWAFGQKMYGSHEGLSQLYEVSCPELDFLVGFTRDKDYVVGARMMGGGFGGCTINIVEKSRKQAFIKEAAHAYHQAFGLALKTYEVAISAGTERVETVRKNMFVNQ